MKKVKRATKPSARPSTKASKARASAPARKPRPPSLATLHKLATDLLEAAGEVDSRSRAYTFAAAIYGALLPVLDPTPPSTPAPVAAAPDSPLDRVTTKFRDEADSQAGEVHALRAEHRARGVDDFTDVDVLPLASLLALLGGGSGELDLLLDLLSGLAGDLHQAFTAAVNEEQADSPMDVNWPETLRPLRARARVIAELYRRDMTPATRDAA